MVADILETINMSDNVQASVVYTLMDAYLENQAEHWEYAYTNCDGITFDEFFKAMESAFSNTEYTDYVGYFARFYFKEYIDF